MKSRFRRLLVIAMAIVSLSMALPSAFAEKAAPLPPGSNLFVFRDGLKYGFMNEWGEAVIPANFVFAREFSEGLAAVCVSGSLMDAVEGSVKDGLWGFIDPKGKLVIQASFADALSFSEGKASVRSAEKKLYGFIDKKGLWVLQPKYYSTGPFSEGFATVTYPSDGFLNDETWIRADGSELLPPEYAFFEDFKEGFGSKRGLFESPDIFSKTGEKVFSLGEVFLPGRFSEGLMVDLDPVSKLYGYRDTSFKFAIPCSWEDALEFHEGLAAVKKDGLYGFIDKTGSLVIQPQFASVPYGFSGGLAAVAAKKNYLTFSDFSYKQLEAAKGGLGGNGYDLDTASYGLRYGYIDKTGAWKISPKFYKADPFSRGVAKINEDSKADPAIHRYCLINSSGRYLKGSEALTTKTSMDFRKGAQTLYSNTKNKENWLSYVPDGLRMKAKEGRGVIIPGLYSTGTQFDCVIKSGSPKLAENSVYVDMQGGFGDICAQIAFEEQSYCIFWYKDKADKDIVPWTVSKAIKPAESNTISFSERNGYLTLSINGTQVSSVYHGYPVGDELFHFTVHIFDNCDVILQSVDITNTPPPVPGGQARQALLIPAPNALRLPRGGGRLLRRLPPALLQRRRRYLLRPLSLDRRPVQRPLRPRDGLSPRGAEPRPRGHDPDLRAFLSSLAPHPRRHRSLSNRERAHPRSGRYLLLRRPG